MKNVPPRYVIYALVIFLALLFLGLAAQSLQD